MHKEKIIYTYMFIIDIIGLIGSIGISIMLIPQIYKVYKTKETEALSYIFLFLGIISGGLMLTYGLYYNLIPVIVVNTCCMTNITVLLILKYRIEYFKKINNIIILKNLEDIII